MARRSLRSPRHPFATATSRRAPGQELRSARTTWASLRSVSVMKECSRLPDTRAVIFSVAPTAPAPARRTPGRGRPLNITASCVLQPVGPVTLTAPPGLALAGGRTIQRCSQPSRQARPHPSRQPLHFATVIFDFARGKKETATATARFARHQAPLARPARPPEPHSSSRAARGPPTGIPPAPHKWVARVC